MTRFTQPENWPDLLTGYALGDLSPEEAEALQQILTEQPELAAEVNQLQEVLALMPYGLPEQEPPPHLKQAILTAAESSTRPSVSTSPSRNLRWLGLAGSVAAAVVLGLGFDNYRLRQELQANRSTIAEFQQEVAASRPIIAALQQPQSQPYALVGTGNAAAASGTVLLDRQQKQVVVVAQNLPALPSGQAYRLWAMPRNSKTPAYCGQFNAESTGRVSTRWEAQSALCSGNPAQLLITAESATAPPVPQGELVMKSAG